LLAIGFVSDSSRKKFKLDLASAVISSSRSWPTAECGSRTAECPQESSASVPYIDIIDLQQIRRDPYFADSVNSIIPEIFLKSTSFNGVSEKVQSKLNNMHVVEDPKPLLIEGPKGTGKITCLLALM